MQVFALGGVVLRNFKPWIPTFPLKKASKFREDEGGAKEP